MLAEELFGNAVPMDTFARVKPRLDGSYWTVLSTESR
jgi:hypothetical protein